MPSLSPPSDDTHLANRLRQRDEAAFEALIERHHGRLLRLARLFVADRSVAEEVVQDTWLAVLTGIDGFEGRSSLKTWIFRILINKAKTRGVRERRSVPFSALAPVDEGPEPAVDPARIADDGRWLDAPAAWTEQTPERIFLAEETQARVLGAIAALPPSQRAVITLRDVEGLDAAEVCNVLDLTETNQRVLLHRARSRVRHALDEYLCRREAA